MGTIAFTVPAAYAQCCCDSSTPDCDCYLTDYPLTISVSISGIPANNGDTQCGDGTRPDPCTTDYSDCDYNNLNGTYDCDVVYNAFTSWPEIYGEMFLGVYCDDVDRGILYRTRYDCADDSVVARSYLWKVRVWYRPCEPCPSTDPNELWDPTKLAPGITVELDAQTFPGPYPLPCSGAVQGYLYCDSNPADCATAALCSGGSCSMYQGDADEPFTINMTVSVTGGALLSEGGTPLTDENEFTIG